jgi:two-component system sensor histidine kinase PilS (NtrC family)
MTMSSHRNQQNRFNEGSWFGALGGSSVQTTAVPQADFKAEQLHRDAASQGDGLPDAQFMWRQVWRLIASGRSSVERTYRTFLQARIVLGGALTAVQLLGWLIGTPPTRLAIVLCLVYFLAVLATWVWSQRVPWLRRQAFLAIGVDLLAFGALYVISGRGAASFNYTALLTLPMLMSGVLLPRVAALGVAAGVTLFVLAAAWHDASASVDLPTALAQAGLVGMGFFLVTLLSSELAARLAREEQTARGGLEMVRQQAQLNRLVIDEMQEGVLVVDRLGWVRAANPAARALLRVPGKELAHAFQLRGTPAWSGLVGAMEKAFANGGQGSVEEQTVTLFSDENSKQQVQLRMRFTHQREHQVSEELCVLFIEDSRAVEARARQNKLAAMGRVSAGIAHEIRNPLAAIAQANALLSEDALTPTQRQLAAMVADNVDRLKRIVDDVMEVAPGASAPSPLIDLVGEVAAICHEWLRTTNIAQTSLKAPSLQTHQADVLKLDLLPKKVWIHFDPHHLRRVLVNLLDNAHRHGTAKRASVWLEMSLLANGKAQLSVFSDGPPIELDVERHLFEPFFSTRSRGTGLGLYICRELCARHGAVIDFHPAPLSTRYRNEFRVIFVVQEEPLIPSSPLSDSAPMPLPPFKAS